VVLRVQVDGAAWRNDEGAYVQLIQPDRRANHDRHLICGRELEKRRQAAVGAREGERGGEHQLVAGQRQLGKHQHPCPRLGGRVHEAHVVGHVRSDVAGDGYGLRGSQRADAWHGKQKG
jgi:hypothetical protein